MRAACVWLLTAALTGCQGDASPRMASAGAGPGGLGGADAAGSSGIAAGAGGGPAPGGTSGGTAELADAPHRELDYAASSESILNPERGFYATASLAEAPDLAALRESGVTLVHSYVRLDQYRTASLPPSLLAQVAAGFAEARRAGVKVVLRFAYNFGPYPDSEPDAPKDWVLTHITELEPLLAENADVIAVVQAGFIGAWGEWHTSTNNLTEPATRQEILEALLEAVPASRYVQLRYPPYKRALYGEALTTEAAFGASYAARVGHHNDCFVSSDTDVGTYPEDEVELYREYVGADTVFVPMGGETCAVSPPRSECASALAEMEKLHFSYINREFHEDVLASWAPCREEMERRLGYRLALVKASLPERVKPGGSFTLRVQLINSGFAAPFNARPVWLRLHGAGGQWQVQLASPDVRRWLRGATFEARLRVPADAAAGSYQLSLGLPDAASSLAERPEYAIRFANEDVWDGTSGSNVLGSVEVTPSAPGTVDATAKALQVLSERELPGDP